MGNPYYRNFGLLDAKALKATGSTACTFTDPDHGRHRHL
jgi:hypothetical protein